MRQLFAALALLWGLVMPAYGLELNGPLTQGLLAFGRAEPGTTIEFGERSVRVDQTTGLFVFGVDRDAPTDLQLVEVLADGSRRQHAFAVAARAYDIERIDGLPARKVTPNEADLDRIRREGALITAARAHDGQETWFAEGFIWPVDGRISGRYGNQRILNGEPRRPHLGIDIAAPTGTPVKAAARGRVTLAEGDLFYTGGTIVLDHGHGVTSIYSHLQDVSVTEGAEVAQGAIIGTVGSTGRSTGPHLDWRINWFQTRLDPALIAGPAS